MSATPSRLISLDAFRGFTIASMVLVNNPGDWNHLYRQLGHAEWNGWTFTDWIFPFFLFICGVSMTLSLGRRAAAGDDKSTLLRQLFKRAAFIFLIGLSLNFIPNFDVTTLRIPGVLQRIALCTVLAAPIVVYCTWRGQVGWIVGLLAIYTIIMLFVPVPDVAGRVGAGILEPGRDAGAFVDRLLLDGHLWAKSKTWDPEGLLSTLPALASQLFGVLLGRGLLVDSNKISKAEKTVWMLLAGLTCLWLGSMLDVVLMPINKSLWTPSYCIFMTGWALCVFAAFYWLIDGNESVALSTRVQKWLLPFAIYGMNALFIFAFSGLVAKMLGVFKIADASGNMLTLKSWLMLPIQALSLDAVNASLLFAVLFNLAMFSVAWGLWKKQWFIKI